MADLVTAKKWLKNANTVIVTAGNGMAKEEGLDILSEEGFDDQFGKIADKYDVHTIGDALDKRFDTWSEQWAFWSELINEYSLQYEPSETMLALKKLIEEKDDTKKTKKTRNRCFIINCLNRDFMGSFY